MGADGIMKTGWSITYGSDNWFKNESREPAGVLAHSKGIAQSYRYHGRLSVQLVSEVSSLCHP